MTDSYRKKLGRAIDRLASQIHRSKSTGRLTGRRLAKQQAKLEAMADRMAATTQ